MTGERPVVVTDHAVLRYLERAHGIPVETIRAALAASAAVGVRYEAPAVRVGKVKLVICDGTVVTVLRSTWLTREQRKAGRRG